jgi:PhoH-like ATPase
MVKCFVLDTNVLIHQPNAIFSFANQEVVIPMIVLEELDKLKRDTTTRGRNARVVIKLIDNLLNGSENVTKGVLIPNGCLFRIEKKYHSIDGMMIDSGRNDSKILMTALYVQSNSSKQVIFVSKDLAARIKSHVLGITAEDYSKNKTADVTDLTESDNDFGQVNRFSNNELYDFFQNNKTANADLISELTKGNDNTFSFGSSRYHAISNDQQDASILCHFDSKGNQLRVIKKQPQSVWGLNPLNDAQRCAIDALLDDNIKLITLIGGAGTGKTLLALAAGLRLVFDKPLFKKILVSRPVIPLGRDLGFLPGTKEEKLSSWMQPIYDNLEFLCNNSGIDVGEIQDWLLKSRKIELEAVTYIRGRSLPKMFIIIDEAQNLTEHEVKTIISRVGKGTKIIFTGDYTQIDHPYLDEHSNGLVHIARCFKGQSIFSQVYLDQSERSKLAALATELM